MRKAAALDLAAHRLARPKSAGNAAAIASPMFKVRLVWITCCPTQPTAYESKIHK